MPADTILVVEDESIVQLHLKKLLERLGYAVSDCASSTREALESAHKCPPDLVLMDIRLADGDDGIETALELRRRYGAPIVFLTAYADDETLRRARAAEPSGYIVKPFTTRDVQATVATALTKHRAMTEIRRHGEWLGTILESLNDGVVVADQRGRVTFLNRAAQELLPGDGDGAVGRDLAEVYRLRRAGGDELVPVALHDALVDARSHPAEEVVADWRGGERALEASTVPLRGKEGRAEGVVLILKDVSRQRLAEERVEDLRRLLREEAQFHGMVGQSRAMERVFQQVREVAGVNWTVLIEGESGTGKELVARAIHAESRRARGPFVPVNTAGLTESLLASQLFGHRKGAFTGAVSDQKGLFRVAHGGTLFLDEVGDVPAVVQASLLRVLEDRIVAPLGAVRPEEVDVRFVAATHRNLAQEVEEGRFRADLLYRLRVARISLPPLRQRDRDLELLATWFLSRAAATAGKSVERLDDAAWARLRSYRWPGNVRELRSAMEHAVIRCAGAVVGPGDLPPEVGAAREADSGAALREALEACDGNRTAAAKLLGIGRATLYRRLAEFGLEAGPARDSTSSTPRDSGETD